MEQKGKKFFGTILATGLLISLSGCAQKAPTELPSKTSQTDKQPEKASNGLDQVLAQLNKVQKNNLFDKLENTDTICSVNGIPLTVGDYRTSFREQQDKVRASLAVDAELKETLLAMARQRGITLSAEEKSTLIKSAHTGQSGKSAEFAKLLKSNNISQSEFDNQVLELGLAYKTSGKLIEERILTEMINRELLASAAKNAGYSKQAINAYIRMKTSPQYKNLLESSGLTEEEAHNAIVKTQLCNFMIKKIQNSDAVTEQEAKEFYDSNKARLQHGARIRFSQIVISCPEEDNDTDSSLKTRLRKINPKMTDSELDKSAKLLENEQRRQAEHILEQARHGADFATLANLNTQDKTARNLKNGGDMGFQDPDQLSDSLKKQLLQLKVGQICPEVIQSSYGFHIIKVTDKEPAGDLSFAECKDRLKQLLSEQKAQDALNKWTNEQLRTAKITISPEFQALTNK
jgi:parvulin-like peptidyl-prolyl isomerase